ncbi:DUF397 domain-containing protein [Streptomyces pseudovenezuelae]|uniref:DUF397 domain-containing protein n=1 Tax=Streptomyces pseudovenezuelae TaxID=67350 RepID=A0ABT6M0Y7_9ACTN|nr:DUF397 domain-containing protein [Streptomyces pseudovenezuelae]MDH6222207.1 hypothetical protein [Streptomyces pseudovenezuelae]
MIQKHAISTDLAPEGAWLKSSYSTGEGGNCVEITDLNTQVGIRDSKNTAGPALVVPAGAWSAFVSLARSHSVEL